MKSPTAKPSGFPDRLRAARKVLGVEAAALAKATGVPLEDLAAWEEGRAKATADDLSLVAAALGRTMDELITGPLRTLPAARVDEARLAVLRRQGGRPVEHDWQRDPAARARLAKNIRAYREARQLSQGQLARVVGVSSPVASLWEKADAPYGPSEENLTKIAEALHTTAEALRGEPPPVLVRAKMMVLVADLPAERRQAIERQIADWEAKFNQQLLDELGADQKRRR